MPVAPTSQTEAASEDARQQAHTAVMIACRAAGLLCDLVDFTYNQAALQAAAAAAAAMDAAAGAADHWGMPVEASASCQDPAVAVESVSPSQVPIPELLTPPVIRSWLRQLAAAVHTPRGFNLTAATDALMNFSTVIGLDAVQAALGQDAFHALRQIVESSAVYRVPLQVRELKRGSQLDRRC